MGVSRRLHIGIKEIYIQRVKHRIKTSEIKTCIMYPRNTCGDKMTSRIHNTDTNIIEPQEQLSLPSMPAERREVSCLLRDKHSDLFLKVVKIFIYHTLMR